MKVAEYNEKVYNVLVEYIDRELKESGIEHSKEYIEEYGLKYVLDKVGKLGKIQLILESDKECRRSQKSDIVDILSFFAHFYEYHNDDNLFGNRFNNRSGKYNLHMMSVESEKFIEEVKRVINLITMHNTKENEE